jgi:hypothetical protein
LCQTKNPPQVWKQHLRQSCLCHGKQTDKEAQDVERHQNYFVGHTIQTRGSGDLEKSRKVSHGGIGRNTEHRNDAAQGFAIDVKSKQRQKPAEQNHQRHGKNSKQEHAIHSLRPRRVSFVMRGKL